MRERLNSSYSQSWHIPPDFIRLKENEVHTWRLYHDQVNYPINNLKNLLAPDELKRSQKFRFTEHQNRFIISWALLRLILEIYLKTKASLIHFQYNPYGKPFLSNKSKGECIKFNMSHSGNISLYAVTRNREIGIDVEFIKSDIDELEIAKHFFSPHEIGELLQVPSQLRKKAFFDCWTRKEAFIKARGEGLSIPLDSFDVSLAPGQPARLMSTRSDKSEISKWFLKELYPGPGYAGALVVEGTPSKIQYWQWR